MDLVCTALLGRIITDAALLVRKISVRSTEAMLCKWQVIQAVSLVVLFVALGFRLSERSEGSGSGGDTDSFRQQLTHILTSPHTVQEVGMSAM